MTQVRSDNPLAFVLAVIKLMGSATRVSPPLTRQATRRPAPPLPPAQMETPIGPSWSYSRRPPKAYGPPMTQPGVIIRRREYKKDRGAPDIGEDYEAGKYVTFVIAVGAASEHQHVTVTQSFTGEATLLREGDQVLVTTHGDCHQLDTPTQVQGDWSKIAGQVPAIRQGGVILRRKKYSKPRGNPDFEEDYLAGPYIAFAVAVGNADAGASIEYLIINQPFSSALGVLEEGDGVTVHHHFHENPDSKSDRTCANRVGSESCNSSSK